MGTTLTPHFSALVSTRPPTTFNNSVHVTPQSLSQAGLLSVDLALSQLAFPCLKSGDPGGHYELVFQSCDVNGGIVVGSAPTMNDTKRNLLC